jgi:GntR family transcriptional repressor for pyruvate dehydrogenase complex
LESLRLISVRPKIGAIVLEPSSIALINAEHLSASAFLQQTDVLVEFRMVLELGLVALAAEKATEEDFVSLRRIVAEQENAVKMERNSPADDIAYHKAIAEANTVFHKAIAEATKNPIAVLILQAISEPLIERSRQTSEVPGVPEAGLREHLAIFRAIEEHNPEKARNAMRLHLQSAERAARIVRATGHVDEPAQPRPHT